MLCFLWFKLDFYSCDLELFCLHRSNKNLVGCPPISFPGMLWSTSQCCLSLSQTILAPAFPLLLLWKCTCLWQLSAATWIQFLPLPLGNITSVLAIRSVSSGLLRVVPGLYKDAGALLTNFCLTVIQKGMSFGPGDGWFVLNDNPNWEIGIDVYALLILCIK